MLKEGVTDTRARHVGRHMEEIAFSMVTKPCEVWDFYSDSSKTSDKREESISKWAKVAIFPFVCSAPEISGDTLFRCEYILSHTGKPCNSLWNRQDDLVSHLDSARKLKCQICHPKQLFWTYDALDRHMDIMHNTPRKTAKTTDRGKGTVGVVRKNRALVL